MGDGVDMQPLVAAGVLHVEEGAAGRVPLHDLRIVERQCQAGLVLPAQAEARATDRFV